MQLDSERALARPAAAKEQEAIIERLQVSASSALLILSSFDQYNYPVKLRLMLLCCVSSCVMFRMHCHTPVI
jgi:dissimilatory sulfite reductase (desulfoviridin) alpha/beta subunit